MRAIDVPDAVINWHVYDVSAVESICVYQTSEGVLGVVDDIQEDPDDSPDESALYRAAIDGINSLLLAMFADGIVVKDDVVQTAVSAAANNS